MGVIGQMPHAPDELPGRETSTGEPPQHDGPHHRGPRADELPTLGPAATHSVSVSVPLPVAPKGETNNP